jgi:hypothetical protein
MIRKSAWAFIILMLVVAASPGAASAIPAGATMMPMNGGSGHHSGSQATGCNCNMPMQATPMARAESPARTTEGTDSSPCSGTATPVYSGIAGASCRFSGIRRIYPKNVLDHPERSAIYTTITEQPGIDLNGIAAEHGMNRETLRYHLDQLESATRVVVLRDRGIVRYYENHGHYTLLERKVLQHFWNPTGKRILALIASRPGITQSEVSTRVAVTPPTIRWYMNRFRKDGLITEQHLGRYTHYTVVPDVVRYLFPAPVDPSPAATAE